MPAPFDLAFSTSWNSSRHRDGMQMAEELVRLGLTPIELGHGLSVSQVEGILRVVERGDVRVSSVHNFCPHPIEVRGRSPDCYEFTSHREADRRRAIKLTRDTVALAARVGAKRVVVHGGRARTMHTYREALELLEGGQFLDKAYGLMKVRAVKKREALGPMLLERLEAALREVAPAAEAAGVQLCLENRERYEDVPSEREMAGFLSRFLPSGESGLSASPVRYWHDFGHAQIKEHLGFLEHEEWLRSISPWLAGGHVHDTAWPNRDHRPPGMGDVRFSALLPLVPPDTLLVFEMSPEISEQEVMVAWKNWKTGVAR